MRKRSEVRIVKRGDQYLILDKDDDTIIPRKGFVSDETRAKISESNKGKKVNIESIKKMSEGISKSKNTSGYYRVSKQSRDDCKQGFIYVYKCRVGEVNRTFSSVDLKKLEAKVVAAGYEWKKL